MTVNVTAPGGIFGTHVVSHPGATHWKETKSGKLVVFSGGAEVGRYKADRWLAVRVEERVTEQ